MATWVLIAIFGTIGITALLIRVLQSANGQGRSGARAGKRSGDSGPMLVSDGGCRHADRDANDNSNGGDSGGGDGGGGGD